MYNTKKCFYQSCFQYTLFEMQKTKQNKKQHYFEIQKDDALKLGIDIK